jgi:hypothetical protein
MMLLVVARALATGEAMTPSRGVNHDGRRWTNWRVVYANAVGARHPTNLMMGRCGTEYKFPAFRMTVVG